MKNRGRFAIALPVSEKAAPVVTEQAPLEEVPTSAEPTSPVMTSDEILRLVVRTPLRKSFDVIKGLRRACQ